MRFTCTCGVVIEGDDVGDQITQHEARCNLVRAKWWEIILNGIFSVYGAIAIIGIIAIIADSVGA